MCIKQLPATATATATAHSSRRATGPQNAQYRLVWGRFSQIPRSAATVLGRGGKKGRSVKTPTIHSPSTSISGERSDMERGEGRWRMDGLGVEWGGVGAYTRIYGQRRGGIVRLRMLCMCYVYVCDGCGGGWLAAARGRRFIRSSLSGREQQPLADVEMRGFTVF